MLIDQIETYDIGTERAYGTDNVVCGDHIPSNLAGTTGGLNATDGRSERHPRPTERSCAPMGVFCVSINVLESQTMNS